MADAAKILRVPQSTLRWWLEGGSKRGREGGEDEEEARTVWNQLEVLTTQTMP